MSLPSFAFLLLSVFGFLSLTSAFPDDQPSFHKAEIIRIIPLKPWQPNHYGPKYVPPKHWSKPSPKNSWDSHNQRDSHGDPHNSRRPVINPSINCTGGTPAVRHNRCDRYYECVNQQAQLRLCPRGAYFDVDFLTCLPANKANCVMIIPTAAPPPTTPRTTTTSTTTTTSRPNPNSFPNQVTASPPVVNRQ